MPSDPSIFLCRRDPCPAVAGSKAENDDDGKWRCLLNKSGAYLLRHPEEREARLEGSTARLSQRGRILSQQQRGRRSFETAAARPPQDDGEGVAPRRWASWLIVTQSDRIS